MTAEPAALADMLRDVLGVTGVETERHDVVRRGERDPIPTMTRLLVWLRDGGVCARCRRADRSLMQLDHIEPWSAGGDDSASNLRVMCGPCNEDRSNFRELGGPRRRASVTPMCDRCVEHHGERRAWTARRRHDQIAQRRPIGCPVCAGSVRIDEWDPPVIAWCGTCGALSAVTGPGRIL